MRIHTWTITALMITPMTQERIQSFKLTDPSPSSDSHEQGGLPTQVTMSHNDINYGLSNIGNTCQENTIKPLLVEEQQNPLIRYSKYQLIDDSFKTPIQPTTTK